MHDCVYVFRFVCLLHGCQEKKIKQSEHRTFQRLIVSLFHSKMNGLKVKNLSLRRTFSNFSNNDKLELDIFRSRATLLTIFGFNGTNHDKNG